MSPHHEIGGYFELEHFQGDIFHRNAIALNSGRGCFAYLVELRSIVSVWVPDYICKSVLALFKREGVRIKKYPIDCGFLPKYAAFTLADNEWLLLVDYYGQLTSEDINYAAERASGRLIVDESQGFFRGPWPGVDTVYTCRKWFGVSDGAYLSTGDGLHLGRKLSQDESHGRMNYLLGRFERPASEFFEEAGRNNDFFASEPAKQMSPVTENILRAVDYETVRRKRDANWDLLEAALGADNMLHPHKPDGAFMYPLLIGEGAQRIRSDLIKQRIYVPTLWPNIEALDGSFAQRFSAEVLPLPVDQRYGEKEMTWMLEVLEECMH